MLVTNLVGRRVLVHTPTYPKIKGELVAVSLRDNRLYFIILLDSGNLTHNLEHDDFTVLCDS